jgi:hypothetical protein
LLLLALALALPPPPPTTAAVRASLSKELVLSSRASSAVLFHDAVYGELFEFMLVKYCTWYNGK